MMAIQDIYTEGYLAQLSICDTPIMIATHYILPKGISGTRQRLTETNHDLLYRGVSGTRQRLK